MSISERQLNMIMQLKNSVRNSSEVKKLEGNIKGLHNAMKDVNSAFQTKKATSEFQKLKKEIDKVVKSFASLSKGKDVDFSQMKKSVADALAQINKLVEAAKRGKGELGKLARDNLGNFKDLVNSLAGIDDILNSFSASAEKSTKKSQELSSINKTITVSFAEEISAANITSASIERLIASYFNYSAAGKTFISVTNNLEKSLLKIQTLGKLQGKSIFEQNINSTKVFLSELEKLSVKLAEVSGKQFVSRTSVTKEMILDYRKMALEVERTAAYVDNLRNAFNKFKSVHESFSLIQKGLEGVRRVGNKAGNEIKGMEISLEALSRAQITLTEGSNEKLGTLIERYDNAKVALKEMILSMGGDVKQGAYSFGVLERAANSALRKVKKGLEDSGITVKKIEKAYNEAILKMESNLKKFSEVDFKTWSSSANSMRGARVVIEEANKAVMKLTDAFGLFVHAEKRAESGTISFKVAQEAANKVIEKANIVLETLGEKHHKNAITAKELAFQYLTNAKVIDHVKRSMEEFSISLSGIENKQKTFAAAATHLGHSALFLRKRVSLASAACELIDNKILELLAKMRALDTGTRKGADAFKYMEASLKVLVEKSLIANNELKTLTNTLMRMEQRVGDGSRALGRMSSEGFANMIISQAAWMAGFQMIFGTLDRFKAALSSVVENQKAVSRAMRTARDDTFSSREIIRKYTDAVNEMRASIGASAEETGEALYQLGSAGLNVRESLAALSSTMDNIIGTEADMEQITNLVAGVYNNFGDQIVKVDGRLATISDTFDEYNKKIVTSATLTEKFQHINDLLVRTFDAHQAEMDQIRDGLKFMAQSAKRANLSLTEQLGILATLHDHLIKAGAAGRGMRVIISRISKDARAFKDAFNLDIDLSAPLDMINIFEQLHKKIEGNVLSVESLGEYFKRFGLRGVEPLLVLIRYFDELRDNITDLEKDSYNAAKAMREVRLDNLGDQARIANEKLNVLIIEGLSPLERVLTNVTGLLNYFGQAIGKTSSLFGGIIGGLFKLAGAIGILALFTFGLKNLGRVAGWVRDVFRYLLLQMKDFGKVAAEATGKASAVAKGTAAVGNAAATASVKVGLLGSAFKFLKYVSGTIVWIAAIEGLARLIEYVGNYRLNLDKETESLKKESAQIKVNIQNFQDLKAKIADTINSSGIWKKIVAELGRTLNLNVSIYKTQEEAISSVNKAIQHRIDLQRELEQANIEKRIKVDIEKSVSDLYSATEYLIRERSALEKVRKLVKGEYASLVESLGETSKTIITLEDRLAELKKAFVNTGSESARKKILSLTTSIERQRNALEKSRKEYKERLNNLRLVSETSEEARAITEKLNAVLGEEKAVVKKTAEEILELADKWKKANEENKLVIRDLGQAFRMLYDLLGKGSSSFSEFEKSFGNLSKKAKFDSFNRQIDSIIDSLFDLGSKGPKETYKIIKASEKLAKEGGQALYQYRKEIYGTQLRIEHLSEEINKIKLRKVDNEIGDFSDKLSFLKRKFEIAGQSAKSFRRETSSISSGMKMATNIASQFGAATSVTASSVDSATRSFERNKKTTMKQKAIQKEMLSTYSESVNKINDSINKYNDYIEVKDKEIAANDKTKRGLERSLEFYNKQKEALDVIKSKYGEELRLIKERIDLEKKMHKISSVEKRKQELEIEEAYHKKLTSLAKSREKIEKNRETILREIQGIEKADMKKAQEFFEDLELSLLSLKTAAANIVVDIKASPDSQALIQKLKEELQFLMDVSKHNNLNLELEISDIKGVEKHIRELQIRFLNEKFKFNVTYEEDQVRGTFHKIETMVDESIHKKLKNIPLSVDFSKAFDDANSLHKNLERRAKKIVEVTEVIKERKTYGNYFGGEIRKSMGGIIPARVTKGEGYFPPNLVRNHRSLLNTLNSGKSVSKIPGSIAMFDGPDGVDNIHTYLPSGSYVLSKKGMEAYEASIRKGAQTFQEGGEVNNISSVQEESSLGSNSIGSFTIVVEKEGSKKEFPVSGKVSVLKGLRAELETERLTRLH